MENTKPITIVPCDNYEEATVREALDGALTNIGGLDFVKPGMKVAIKANLVSMMAPEKAATTHPELIKALCRRLVELGAEVTVGDSPGGLYTAAYVKNVYKAAGLEDLPETTGARLNENFEVASASFPEAVSIKNFEYTAWLKEADLIIDFCKLKTHGMMGLTCAVKNMFGAIPGMTKPQYHMRFPETMAFANMIVDLNEYFKPALYVVDAVEAMEGNGPTAGIPRHMGALLASRDGYGLDVVCAHLIGLSVDTVPTIRAAADRDLGPSDMEGLEIIGDPEPYVIPDFQIIEKEKSITFQDNTGVVGLIKMVFVPMIFSTKPKVKKAECIGCGKCAEMCPAGAITMEIGRKGKLPKIDRSKCIHCFCCQEFCPKGAMKVHRTLIARILK